MQSYAQLYFIEKKFEPKFLAELIANQLPAVNITYYKEIELIYDYLFGLLVRN